MNTTQQEPADTQEPADAQQPPLSVPITQPAKNNSVVKVVVVLFVALLFLLASGILWQQGFSWHIWLIPIFILILAGLIFASYTTELSKVTGFVGENRFGKRQPKTLWDWLNSMVLIALMVGVFTAVTTIQQNQIVVDQQRENVLLNYESDISNLLLNYDLGSSQKGDLVRNVARAKTLITLSRLDPDRKGALIQFLYGANLLFGYHKNAPYDTILQLTGANLASINLRGIDLRNGIDLSAANMPRADLRGANLVYANLEKTNLLSANLLGADLAGADLRGANLKNANVTNAQLAKAWYLKGATLPDGSIYPSKSYPIPNHIERS